MYPHQLKEMGLVPMDRILSDRPVHECLSDLLAIGAHNIGEPLLGEQ